MNPNRMANHRRGEKAKLLFAVEELCEQLVRPICSGDLREFFRELPERRPCLLKRLGQQLIVAAEAQDGVVPHLKRIGIFRHKAYYALSDALEWRQRFSDHCIEQQVDELLRLNIPDHILTLRERGWSKLAAHAAGGWLAEIAFLENGHSDPSRVKVAVEVPVDFVPVDAASFFVPGPAAFVGRFDAMRFLEAHARIRRLWDAPLSPYRHLVRLRWPQSPIFPAIAQYAALREQLFHFVRGKWPIDEEDELKHRAYAECLRYGAPAEKSGWYLPP